MDTTETYILQCRKATEMQPGEEAGGVWLTTLGNDILFDPETQKYYHVKDTYCSRTCPDCGHSDDHIVSSVYTWLPTQAQLQAMYKPTLGNTFALFGAFDMWMLHSLKDNIEYVTSWEQLWLAFIMESVHRKRWDGTDWVNLPPST